MNKTIYQKFPFKLIATAALGTIVYKNFTEANPSLNGHHAKNYSRRFYPASSEYPEITKNRNIMARNLSPSLYARLRDLRTPNGFTVDDAIQTGVDNVGKFSTTGIVAGDEETYYIFRELFDKVIYDKHGFKRDQQQISDFNADKLKDVEFDPDYVLSIRVRTLRNISGYCFPSFCTRGERRDVESLLAQALYAIDDDYKGVYYSIKELTNEEEASLAQSGLGIERPYLPDDVSSNLARDWPDSRGIWFNNDKTLSAVINRKDHILLSSTMETNNFKQVFSKCFKFTQRIESQLKKKKWRIMHNTHLGYLTSDPKNLGTALKLSVRIKLPELSQDSRISALLKMFNLSQTYRTVKDSNGSVLEITSIKTLGKSEVEIAQDFIDSINQIIMAEKKLANGEPLDDILYKK